MKYQEIRNPKELLEFMDCIKYETPTNWHLLSPKELLNIKKGICFDQVELQREWFNKNNYENKTYYLVFYNCDNKNYSTHTFLVYKDNNKWYYFEHSWEYYKGIYEFNSLKEAYNYVSLLNLKEEKPDDVDIDKLRLYEYNKPLYNIDYKEYSKYIITNGKEIDIKEIRKEYKNE